MSVVSVPFEVESVGVIGTGVLATRASGVLRVEAQHLVLEFRTHSSDLREYTGVAVIVDTGGRPSWQAGTETELRTVRIPLEHMVELRMKGGWLFTPRVQLEVSQVAALADVPWADGARCTVTVRRADRQRARSLAVEVQLRLADARLRELEAG